MYKQCENDENNVYARMQISTWIIENINVQDVLFYIIKTVEVNLKTKQNKF